MIKMSPVKLKVSQEMRLQRLHKGRYLAEQGLLAVGMRTTKDLALDLTEILRSLIPPGEEALAT